MIFEGARFWIVTPYLEHPPLFGLIAGGYAIMNGIHSMQDVTLPKIRPLAIFLGVASIFLLFILVRQVYGTSVALIASAIYSVTPTLVIGSRIVQNENFLIPCWLLALILINNYLQTGRKSFRNLAAILAGLLSLAKVPWLIVGVSLALILSFKHKWKDAILVGIITLGIFSLFILYVFYFDKDLFVRLWQLQVARYDISFSGFFSLFTSPLLVDRFYLDGWILFGWFAILFMLKDTKKNFLIILPFISYLLIYIFAIPNEPSHGWYRYPFYPFLTIATALFLWSELKKISLSSLVFLFVVGLSLLSNFWLPMFGFSYSVYRIFIILAFFSVFIPIWFARYDKIGRIILALWFCTFLILSACSVITYIE